MINAVYEFQLGKYLYPEESSQKVLNVCNNVKYSDYYRLRMITLKWLGCEIDLILI